MITLRAFLAAAILCLAGRGVGAEEGVPGEVKRHGMLRRRLSTTCATATDALFNGTVVGDRMNDVFRSFAAVNSSTPNEFLLTYSLTAEDAFKDACFAARAGWCTGVDGEAAWGASSSLSGSLGFCFDPVCCEQGECDLQGGVASLIEGGFGTFLQGQCSNGSAALCPVGGAEVAVSTRCAGGTSTLLWWTMLGVGGAVFLCFCIALAARFSFFRCTARGRANRRAQRLTDLLEEMLEAEAAAGNLAAAAAEEAAAATEVRVVQAEGAAKAYTPGKDDVYGTACIVCLESLSEAQPGQGQGPGSAASVIHFPTCGHVFHAPCLLEWLAQKDTCPVCRTPWPQDADADHVDVAVPYR